MSEPAAREADPSWPADASDRALLGAARLAAREAAALHRREAGRVDPADWQEKGVADFVTAVDLESERAIVRVLRDRFPDHAIVAEEGTAEEGASNPSAERDDTGSEADPGVRWIIDPLDGTTNWLHGYPEYAVSIAALDERGLRVGVVRNSATGETFEAVRGAGSRLDGTPIRTSGVRELRLSLLGTGFPFKRAELIPPYLRTLEAALRSTSGVRRAGSAALDLCDLACGRLDAFWELWLMPWDVAAGALVLREAGGVFAPFELPAAATAGGPEGTGDPEAGLLLREASEGARAFLRACDGKGGRLGPGAYLGANAYLREPVERLLATAWTRAG